MDTGQRLESEQSTKVHPAFVFESPMLLNRRSAKRSGMILGGSTALILDALKAPVFAILLPASIIAQTTARDIVLKSLRQSKAPQLVH